MARLVAKIDWMNILKSELKLVNQIKITANLKDQIVI